MAITGQDPDELFDALHCQDNFRGYAFSPRETSNGELEGMIAEEFGGDGGANDVPGVGRLARPRGVATSGRPRLQTQIAPDKLERRLTKIFRDERTLQEEQGLSTLFLAIGFLKWFDSDQSEDPSFAPLILLPVTMARGQGRDGYILLGREDDVVVNVSLREKLKGDGIFLPDIPEGDDWKPSEYLESVANVVSGRHRWQVERSNIGLGFFTFAKFMMWRDLDANVWGDGGLIDHSILNTLLGENVGFENAPPVADGDESIDERIDLSACVHIVDADSSQAVVVEEARRGRNLVVQGPPGTGKSQTITNIIASAVHEGKSVLFLAEKVAALDVVYDRLKRAGLGALCIEMHSRKTNKREVLRSLEEALRTSDASRIDESVPARLSAARDDLNNCSRAIHASIGLSNRTVFAVMGAQLKLRSGDVPLFGASLNAAADWAAEKLANVEKAIDRASTAVAKIGYAPNLHSWFGADIDSQSPFDEERLRGKLQAASEELNSLNAQLSGIFKHVADSTEPSIAAASATVQALRHVAAAPPFRAALCHPAWSNDLNKLEEAIERGRVVTALAVEIDRLFNREAWSFDTDSLLLALRGDGRSFFRRFSRRYRQGKADLRAICRGAPPRTLNENIDLVVTLQRAQAALRSYKEVSEFLRDALGRFWADAQTVWGEAQRLAEWSRMAFLCLGRSKLLELASRTQTLAVFKDGADRLELAIRSADSALVTVLDAVQPNLQALFRRSDVRDVPIGSLTNQIALWLANIHAVNDWVGVRKSLLALRDEGLSAIAQALEDGRLSPQLARPVTDLLIAEALWKRATKDNPGLAALDGARRSERVGEFQRLDKRRIQIARDEVLARYVNLRPNGFAGEMGIIRGEIEKKRGHRALRRLIVDAGGALQRLKPICLMSPLSVAQFLPPGRITFDVLVVDEASQIAPEDALGAITRARQIVVVGDDKQLPPTNFFKTVNAGGETATEDDVDEERRDRASDYESILTLARTRGMAERMLAWHYRSKHPSLIALSNDECYGGRLLLPPSPFVHTDEFGLSLVTTPRGHYDRGGTSRDLVQAEHVAKAIAQHIRQFPSKSLAVACLSAQQRDAVDDMIDMTGIRSDVEAFLPKGERLFVKNLEAVQGDERDVIFISIGYGVAPNQSRPFQNFGPVSRDGGERRLNVLASRAREKCIIFSSITAADISADSEARGTRMLRALLDFAETGRLGAGTFTDGEFDSPFEEAVARIVRQAGYRVDSQVGVSSFRIDLGVIDRARPGRYLLGVECDGATYHSARSARDRDRLRQEVLEGLGWRLHRIWSTDWFRNPGREAARLLTAIREAAEQQQIAEASVGEGGISGRPSEQTEDDADQRQDAQESDRPPARPSNVETYEEVALTVPHGRELLELSVSEIGRLGLEVVKAEGPIHLDEVARRIREAFGLQKTGGRILTHVRDGLIYHKRDGGVACEDEFWSVAGRETQKIRDRRVAALPLRKATMISPVEYQLAIVTALNESVSLTLSDLLVQTARLFGFDRTGPELKHEIERNVARLEATVKIAETDGMLRVIPDKSH